jgi:hypothetical protein
MPPRVPKPVLASEVPEDQLEHYVAVEKTEIQKGKKMIFLQENDGDGGQARVEDEELLFS